MEWIALQLGLQVCDASSAASGRNWTRRVFFLSSIQAQVVETVGSKSSI